MKVATRSLRKGKDAIPICPPGCFTNCYRKEEVREQNRLAKASVVRAPAEPAR